MYLNLLGNDVYSSYDFLHREVSNEDFNLSALTKMLSNVGKTVDLVKEVFEKTYNKHDYIQLLSVDIRKLSSKLDSYNYTDLAEIKIFKPLGMKGTYNDLLTNVETVQEDLIRIEERVFNPYLLWSGEVLNAPEKISRITINRRIDFLNVKKSNELLDKNFSELDTGDVSLFGDAFESNHMMIDVAKRLNPLIEIQNTLPPKVIMEKLKTINERSESLIRLCKTQKDNMMCSRESRKVMADVFYDIGMELTLYGRLSYILMSTQTAMEDSIDKLLAMR